MSQQKLRDLRVKLKKKQRNLVICMVRTDASLKKVNKNKVFSNIFVAFVTCTFMYKETLT